MSAVADMKTFPSLIVIYCKWMTYFPGSVFICIQANCILPLTTEGRLENASYFSALSSQKWEDFENSQRTNDTFAQAQEAQNI